MMDIARWGSTDDPFDVFFPTFLRPVDRRQDGWTPRMDVFERENAYGMAIELPGVDKNAIQVSIYDNRVTVTAEVREEKQAADAGNQETWLLRERGRGKVSRSVTLPETVDETTAEARHVDGVLYLTLPKKQATRSKRLTIH
jgi:HSP20 family protein